MAANMLKELPSFNKENFSKFKVDDNMKSNLRAATYIQTKDLEEEKPQVIVTDKTNILLRYLRQQLTVKNKQSKRTVDSSTDSTPQAKHARVDFEENEND